MTAWPILALVGLAVVGAWLLLQLVEAVDLLRDLERDEESRPARDGMRGRSSEQADGPVQVTRTHDSEGL